MIDFACVSSTTPTWSNDPRWCIPGIAATEAEHAKLAADRASSAPVQGVHRYYPLWLRTAADSGNQPLIRTGSRQCQAYSHRLATSTTLLLGFCWGVSGLQTLG
eukprot:jgi/Tetstr1/463568/TSEL_008447.t1